jgi:hypothetical protein
MTLEEAEELATSISCMRADAMMHNADESATLVIAEILLDQHIERLRAKAPPEKLPPIREIEGPDYAPLNP